MHVDWSIPVEGQNLDDLRVAAMRAFSKFIGDQVLPGAFDIVVTSVTTHRTMGGPPEIIGYEARAEWRGTVEP